MVYGMFSWKALWISREARVAGLIVALGVLGEMMFRHHAPTLGAILFLAAVAVAGVFWAFVIRPARIPRDSVLMLRLAGSIPEDIRRSPFDQLFHRHTMGLRQLRYGLEAVVSDRRVRAVVVHLAGVEAGLATAHEMHRLLRATVAAGKRVIAVMTGDSPSLTEYLIASGASEIVINPDAMLVLLGVAIASPFLREALEHVGVRVQTLQWKQYKGAAEMLTRDTMSPELRESLEAIIQDREKVLVEALKEARRLEPERARELLSAGFLSPRAAREAGLVDREGYLQDVRKELDLSAKGKPEIGFGRYLRRVTYLHERGVRPRIAVVLGNGPVIAGDPPPRSEFISGETTADEINRAARDEQNRAIVFRINSPGGSAVGSDLVWRAVREAQERGKPVIVSMGEVAGSGGYYVAMGADSIVAEPATITGSIGVVYMKLDLSRMLGNLGVRFDYAKTAQSGDALSLARAMSEAELEQLNSALGEVYRNFTAKVSQGRKLSAEQTEEVARGRVWSGLAARERGLVDELGGFGRAVELAREKGGIPPGTAHQLVLYSAREPLFSIRSLLSPAQVPARWQAGPEALNLPSEWAPALLQLLTRGGMLLLGPFLRG
jgi:protease-4